MLNIKNIYNQNKGLTQTFRFISKTMKFPWFSSEKSSKNNTEPSENNETKEIKKTYKISSLPKDLQTIAILIQQNDQEIKYLNKKLEVSLTAKKVLEEDLSRRLKSIKE